MLSLRNRIYGLAIGGIVADSMGAVAAYAPDLQITSPISSLQAGIQPGYWTEPTGLFLARLASRGNGIGKVPTCTGVYAECNLKTLPLLVQNTPLCIIHEDLSRALGCGQMDDVTKLWLAFMDGVLHGLPKKMLFNHSIYHGLPPNIISLLDGSGLDLDLDNLTTDGAELDMFREVLQIFRNTNNYIEGLTKVVNECMAPAWTATIYGQLAGAYYGITDIPESWMDHIQQSSEILSLLESVSNARLKGVGTDLGVSAEEKHVSAKPSRNVATV